MTTVAEGVETPQQLAKLRVLGCGKVQGFLFSPPVPVSDVPRLIRTLRGTDLEVAADASAAWMDQQAR